jgi:Family of unknown function (DUF6314)
MKVRTAETLAFLLGTWDLERVIEDYRSRTDGLFRGSGTLVQNEAASAESRRESALYQESGELRFGSQLTRASRTLLYERLPDASVLLRFADGKPFVDLNLESGEWRGLHHCVDDLYEMTTTVRSARVVEERWRVTGPSKDYLAVTTLTRVA